MFVLAGLVLLIPLGLLSPNVLSLGHGHWVGVRDLEITFRIVDADTGLPVKQAKVHVFHEDTNFCKNREKIPFSLVSDDDGIVRHLSRQCLCFGTESGFGPWREDTFAIHIPGWCFQVKAPGYKTSEPLFLDTTENQRRVDHGGKTAALRVVVTLQKDDPVRDW